MRIDVSEIKESRTCKRKWEYSSRNMWHLTSRAPIPALAFGTLFHECLHALYLGGDYDRVLLMIEAEVKDPLELKVMTNMITGYMTEVLPFDFDTYRVLEIEHGFNFPLVQLRGDTNDVDIDLCGSIDMITLNRETNEIVGFEHKSTARFKTPMIIRLDEQPRVYFEELNRIVAKWNIDHPEGPEVTNGGIFINEVKKVQKKFEYQRTLCKYSERDQKAFFQGIINTGCQIARSLDDGPNLPEPGPMKCIMCSFASLCDHFQYEAPTLEEVLGEFAEEFAVRDVDHLDEKADRVVDE